MSFFSLLAIFFLSFIPSQAQVGWRDGPSPNILRGLKISFHRHAELSGPGGVSEPHLQGSVQEKQPGSFAEANEKMDSQFLGNYEGNVDNNNNDQTNVNSVNNMDTVVLSNNNNVNVLDVILVGSPRKSHRPIG